MILEMIVISQHYIVNTALLCYYDRQKKSTNEL